MLIRNYLLYFQDTWRLNEGFVAEEGIAILPHLGATGPDIAEIHLALLLQCFLEVTFIFFKFGFFVYVITRPHAKHVFSIFFTITITI